MEDLFQNVYDENIYSILGEMQNYYKEEVDANYKRIFDKIENLVTAVLSSAISVMMTGLIANNMLMERGGITRQGIATERMSYDVWAAFGLFSIFIVIAIGLSCFYHFVLAKMARNIYERKFSMRRMNRVDVIRIFRTEILPKTIMINEITMELKCRGNIYKHRLDFIVALYNLDKIISFFAEYEIIDEVREGGFDSKGFSDRNNGYFLYVIIDSLYASVQELKTMMACFDKIKDVELLKQDFEYIESEIEKLHKPLIKK